MKDYPQNKEQWANEAYQSLRTAWAILLQKNPHPNEQQKQKLIEISATLACENRDINDASYIEHAKKYTMDEFMVDYNSRDIIQEINFSLCFALAYFDAHLSLSMISEDEAKEAISYLKSNFDLSYTGQAKNNVFSVDFSKKS